MSVESSLCGSASTSLFAVGWSLTPVIVTVTSCVITPRCWSSYADGVGLGDDLIDRQLLRQRVVDRERPVHRAEIVVVGDRPRAGVSVSVPSCWVAGSNPGKFAEIEPPVSAWLDQVGIDQIDVLERDRARSRSAGRPPTTPPDAGANSSRRVVGASSAPVIVTVTSG